MKLFKILSIVAVFGLIMSCNEQEVRPAAQLDTFKDSLSYSFGVMLAQNIKSQAGDIDADVVAAALIEALESEERLTMPQCQEVYMAYNEKKSAEQGEAGIAYLEENAKKEGITTTASGLQYRILQEGTGEYPTATSTVKVHYTGKLIDGTVFDSSVERGEPISFPLNGVIPGWTEGVQLINVGGKIELTIPYQLGYGERGSGPIPPRATLVFEVELLEIEG